MSKNYFGNKCIWITGASSGIGKAFAEYLADHSKKLIISSRNLEKLEDLKKKLEDKVDIQIQQMDMESEESISEACKKVLSANQIDLLFNNAGISQRSLARETAFEVDQKIIQTNLIGPIQLSKKVLEQMVARKTGHIVVISSVTGKLGVPYRSAYAASKHGLHGYFDSVRAEEYDNNINVSIIVPGYVNTNISVNALKKDGLAQGTKDINSAKGLDVNDFTKKMAKGIARRKHEMVIGKKEKYSVYLKRFLPGLLNRIVKNIKP